MSTKYACKEQQQPPLRKDLLEMAPTRRSLEGLFALEHGARLRSFP